MSCSWHLNQCGSMDLVTDPAGNHFGAKPLRTHEHLAVCTCGRVCGRIWLSWRLLNEHAREVGHSPEDELARSIKGCNTNIVTEVGDFPHDQNSCS